MPRIIVKCRYVKSAPAHRSNLVEYMATREGVDKKVDVNHPTTKKQEELIAELLRAVPDARDSFEYEDYAANPTVRTASEFITQTLEQNADRFADRKVFLEYIANRPRVQKLGAHGLFGDTDKPINLSEVQRVVSEHPANVWTNVVSLRREDAARLGYDNAAAWRALMREKQYEIAGFMRIKPENLKWYAAFHDEGTHPHIHFIVYSTDPNEAYLNRNGIDGIRSCLARKIFQQDLQQIYQQQTAHRDELNREGLSVMREMCEAMRGGVCDNPKIESLMQTLADRLSKTGGKKVYGYLKPDVKAIVDSIVDELAADPRVAACYAAWYEMRNQVLQTYADKLPEPLPLSQQGEFKPLKNMIIQQAVGLGSIGVQIARGDEPEYIAADDSDVAPDFIEATGAAPDFIGGADFGMIDVDDGLEADDDPAYRAEWSEGYKLARDLLYGTHTQPPDFDEVHRLFMTEAASGNALAMHDLGRMYAGGLGRDADAEAAHGWYAKALAGFHAVESSTHKPYIQYRIGKMYAAGLGTEQDYTKAAEWFASAAAKNHKHAQYSLGSLYYRRQGVAQDYEKAFALYSQSAEQENAYSSYEIAKMLRDGIGCAKDLEASVQHFKTAFNGFQDMEAGRSDDKLQYRLGQMLRDGVGTEPDAERAQEYFEASAKLGNQHAQYAMAKMLIEASGDAEKIAEAVSWLSKSADAGNQFAQYTLGKMHRDGTHVEKDIPKTVAMLTLSAEQGNEFAQYAIGKLYLAGEDTPKDVPAAMRWFTTSAEQGNQFSQYQLGKVFLLGRDIPPDRDQAAYWFTLSAEQGNEYAQWFLDHMNPSLMSSATGLLRSLERLFEDQRQKQSNRADHIDRKRARELRQKLQAQGHAHDEQIQHQSY